MEVIVLAEIRERLDNRISDRSAARLPVKPRAGLTRNLSADWSIVHRVPTAPEAELPASLVEEVTQGELVVETDDAIVRTSLSRQRREPKTRDRSGGAHETTEGAHWFPPVSV